MPWSTYKDYYVGYQDTPKNIVPYRLYLPEQGVDVWLGAVTWTSGGFFDGYIVFSALNDKYMHDIFEYSLNTPVAVNGVPATKDR